MSGYKAWVDDEILEAADLNYFLMQQTVPRFATTVARDAAIGSPEAGQLCAVAGVVQRYAGSAWGSLLPTPARTGLTAAMVAGVVTVSDPLTTASTRHWLSHQVIGGTMGHLYVLSRIVGTSFTIKSTSTTDTSTVAWRAEEP